MGEYRKYSLKQSRLKRSFLDGFSMDKKNGLNSPKETLYSVFISDVLDGVEEDALWGRLHMELSMDEDMVITIYALASNQKYILNNDEMIEIKDFLHHPNISLDKKRHFMEEFGAIKFIQHKNNLLYDIKGRYLYVMIELYGTGAGRVSDMYVDNQGDFYMDVFPEVYREYGSFFHRYLSVFSSEYLDFQRKINSIADYLDINTAPVELLPVFGKWLGLDISGDFLSEEKLRLLMKEAYALNRMKGTKTALARVCEIVLGEEVIILEKNVLQGNTQAENHTIYEELYGEGMFDITLLVNTYVPEDQKSQLLFLLNQFKPIRSRLLIRFLDAKGDLDSHAYMDMNAYVADSKEGVLDERIGLDGNVLLLE